MEASQQNQPEHRDDSLLAGTASGLAIGGGLLFIGLIVVSLISIIGRKLGYGSITGDVELMQAGTAVAAAAFLPYCTRVGDHLRVDFFTDGLPRSVRRIMDAICEAVLCSLILVLAWRTTLSALHLQETGDVTALLGLPIWIPVALMVPSLILTAVCSAARVCAAFRCTSGADPQQTHCTDQGVSA